MNNPIITVVVPVYNVEAYLRPCLDSLEQQTFRDFEAILINDGSTDGSLQILQEYAERNENFFLIDQKNSGVSIARNKGIACAKGEYLAFLDSDDILRKDYLERMYTELCKREADIVCCEYKFLFENGICFRFYPGCYTTNDPQKAIRRLMRDITVHHFCWNKLFKTSLFRDHDIWFPSMRFEDVATIARVFYYAKKISFIPQPLYYYVQRDSSFMHSFTYNRLQEYINSIAILRAFFEQTEEFEDYRAAIQRGEKTTYHNVLLDLTFMHLQERTPGLLRDMKLIKKQFQLFKLPTLPIAGMPWEEIVTSTVFDGKNVPAAPTTPAPKKKRSSFSSRKQKKAAEEAAG